MFKQAKQRIERFEDSHENFREVAAHVKKYQLVYGVVASSAITMVLCRSTMKVPPTQIINTVSPTIAPVMSNVVNNTVNNGSYMRKIIRCIETDEMWPSVSKAAEAANTSLTTMSRHLNGHRDSAANGLHYAIEGLASG